MSTFTILVISNKITKIQRGFILENLSSSEKMIYARDFRIHTLAVKYINKNSHNITHITKDKLGNKVRFNIK